MLFTKNPYKKILRDKIWLNMFVFLFYYYSLPEFPEKCKVVLRNDIILRDLLLCSGKFHYEYPRFENFSYDDICHNDQVRKLLNSDEEEKYIILYSRYKFLNDSKESYITGYFKVGEKYKRKYNYLKTKESYGFSASEYCLIKRNEAFKIDYTGQGVPSNKGDGEMSKKLELYLDKLKNLNPKNNVSDIYKSETNRILNLLSSDNGLDFIKTNCTNGGCKEKKCYFRSVLNRKGYGLEYIKHFYDPDYHIGFIFDRLEKDPLQESKKMF